jgi:hypothetical protein
MDWKWLSVLALLGVQGVAVGVALAGLCLPLTIRLARRIHRYRAPLMVAGLLASFWPLFYSAMHVGPGAKLFYLKYLVASAIIAVVHVAVWYQEDKRRIERHLDTQIRM